MEIVNHPAVMVLRGGADDVGYFRVRSFFLPTHDYTHPCDGQMLSGYDFSAVGYDFFLPMHMT